MFGKKQQKTRRPVGRFDTLVSSKTVVEGDVHFSGGLHVDGRSRGNVVADEGSDAILRVSEVGEIQGDIIAPHVIINGCVRGDVHSSGHLELADKASIQGTVYYNLIEMAVGASVNGSLVHRQESAGFIAHEQPAQDDSAQSETETVPESERAGE